MFFVDVFLWILSYDNEYIDDDDFDTYTDDDRDLSDFLLFCSSLFLQEAPGE